MCELSFDISTFKFTCLPHLQMEHSALQAELQKERQAKENALAQMHMAANRELENTELLQQVNTLQVCYCTSELKPE